MPLRRLAIRISIVAQTPPPHFWISLFHPQKRLNADIQGEEGKRLQRDAEISALSPLENSTFLKKADPGIKMSRNATKLAIQHHRTSSSIKGRRPNDPE
jgi:methyl coenzyme M reductase beta subunit